MRKIKSLLKKLLVSFFICYIVLLNTSSSFARNFDDGARSFLAEQTQQFIDQYASITIYSTEPEDVPAHFNSDKSIFYSCCTTGIAYMYEIFLGLDIYSLRI